MKANTKARERIRTAQRCKACRKTTEHERMELNDGTKFLRCVECGQRPDRPRDGHKIKVTCPECGKRTTARYCDDDGMDTYAVECEKCGPVMMAYDDLIHAQTPEYANDKMDADSVANTILKLYPQMKKLTRVIVTVGHATAIAERK